MPHRFWFKKISSPWWKYYLKQLHIPFVLFCFFCYVIFSTYHNVTSILFRSDKIDIFSHDLQDIALYFRWYDQTISDAVVDIDTVVQSYKKWDNIFIQQAQTLDTIFAFIKDQKKYLTTIGFEQYDHVMDFVVDALQYKEEIYDLLWKTEERNYIVILQNSAEKRPNGGFFWSFWFVTIQSWFIENVEVIDSYYPNRIAPDIQLQAPERSYDFIPDKLIWFVAANKFGFTNIDWRNIKNLYNHIFNHSETYERKQDVIDPWVFERTFNKKVHWVIFVRSDTLTQLLPWLQERLRERQFINANVDILRQKEKAEGLYTWDFSNKKESYLSDVNQFFEKNKTVLFANLIRNFDVLTDQKNIQIYIDESTTDVSDSWLLGLLHSYNLVNNYSSWMAYFRDTNDSFNKVDTFVQKTISLYTKEDKLIWSGANDMMFMKQLDPWEYTIRIKYHVYVPESYILFMRQLEQKYWIIMW